MFVDGGFGVLATEDDVSFGVDWPERFLASVQVATACAHAEGCVHCPLLALVCYGIPNPAETPTEPCQFTEGIEAPVHTLQVKRSFNRPTDLTWPRCRFL